LFLFNERAQGLWCFSDTLRQKVEQPREETVDGIETQSTVAAFHPPNSGLWTEKRVLDDNQRIDSKSHQEYTLKKLKELREETQLLLTQVETVKSKMLLAS